MFTIEIQHLLTNCEFRYKEISYGRKFLKVPFYSVFIRFHFHPFHLIVKRHNYNRHSFVRARARVCVCVMHKLVSSMNIHYEIRYVTRADKLGNFQRCKVHSHCLKGWWGGGR